MAFTRRGWIKLAGVAAGAAGASASPVLAKPADEATRSPAAASILAPGAGHDYRGALEALKRYVDLHLATYAAPGMTLSVTDAEGFVAVITAGWSDIERREPVRAEQLFQIGSISKSFAGLAILRLADAGKLNLDDPAVAHLSGVALPDGAEVSIRHLLTHSAGLAADAPLNPRGGGERLWQGFAPGSQFSYSNTGYQILGQIIAALNGAPYAEALSRSVLAPMGLSALTPAILAADRPRYAASYQPYYADRPCPRRGRIAPATWINMTEASGCMAATSRQMADYARWLIRLGAGDAGGFLSEASRRAFVSPAIKAPAFGPQAHYALGLAIVPVDDRPCLHHTGGMVSFSSAIHVDPAAGVGAFASLNVHIEDEYRPRDVTAYAVRLLRAAREGKPLPAAAAIPSPTALDKPGALAGRYRAAGGETIVLAPSGDGLALVHADVSHSLQPQGDGVFFAVGPSDQVSGLVVSTESGAVRAVGWGERLYLPEGAVQPPPLAPELARLAGVYDSGNPWTGMAEVVARPDGLWLNGVTPLIAQGDGAFRVGSEPWSPERARFDADLDGRPQRLIFSGADLQRL